MITYDDFKKVELRVARVLEASRVEGSDKLLKLRVQLGCKEPGHDGTCLAEHAEVRQIIAGVGKAYEPEVLVGKEIIIVANLEPRALMGLESQGMLLAARGEDGRPVIVMPEKDVPSGSSIS